MKAPPQYRKAAKLVEDQSSARDYIGQNERTDPITVRFDQLDEENCWALDEAITNKARG
jgi:hypothetical protein